MKFHACDGIVHGIETTRERWPDEITHSYRMYIAFLPYLNAHANPRLTNDARNEIRVRSPPADFGPDDTRVHVIHVRNTLEISRDMQFPASTYDNLCPWEFPRERRRSISIGPRRDASVDCPWKNRRLIGNTVSSRALSRGSITVRDNTLRRGYHSHSLHAQILQHNHAYPRYAI